MEERLTWEEIANKYPDQWVGLVEVQRRGATVISAIVKYTDLTADELLDRQIDDDDLYSCYTTPDNLAPMGTVGYSE